MPTISQLVCHDSLIVKRTGFVESKYVITSAAGDELFRFKKNGKISGRGRQLLLLDSTDRNPILMIQITKFSPFGYSFGFGKAQMVIHSFPGGNHMAQVVMKPSGLPAGVCVIRDTSGLLMTFERKLVSFSYKFKNKAGVPIAKVKELAWHPNKIKVDFHSGLDNESRLLIMAAAFFVTKVEFNTAS